MNDATQPNRWEVPDEPEEDIVDADGLDAPAAHALALRYGLNELLPAQSFAPVDEVRAVVLDRCDDRDGGWELTALFYGPPQGWAGMTVIVPTADRPGLARAAAWLLRHGPPLLPRP